MECRHSKAAAAAAAAHRSSPSPQLQRSRSGSTASSRLCSSAASSTVPSPFSPSQQATPARSTKPGKESRERESPRPGTKPLLHSVRSAWALSPGRSLAAPAEGSIGGSGGGGGGERKKNGMMGFLTMGRRKGVSEKEAAVHQLRLLTSRLLQWRFVNARAGKATATVRSSVERKLFMAWLRINELRNIVAAKWIVIQRRRHKMKLACILNPQVLHLLKKWEPLSKRNLEAVTALSTVLQAMCVPLPLVDGAQVDLILLHDYISMSMDMMIEIEAAIRMFYSKAEELSLLLSELAETVVLEMEGLKQLMSTNTLITSLEMHETSLRANLIQTVKKEIELPQMSSLSLQMAAWRQYHPWNILA